MPDDNKKEDKNYDTIVAKIKDYEKELQDMRKAMDEVIAFNKSLLKTNKKEVTTDVDDEFKKASKAKLQKYLQGE